MEADNIKEPLREADDEIKKALVEGGGEAARIITSCGHNSCSEGVGHIDEYHMGGTGHESCSEGVGQYDVSQGCYRQPFIQ